MNLKEKLASTLNEYTDDEGGTIGFLLNKRMPPNKWHNFGDVNYMEYGGDQLKWDGGNLIEIFNFSGEPTDGAWYVSQGSFSITDLVMLSDDAEVESTNVAEWPLDKLELTEYGKGVADTVGATDGDLLSIILGVFGYGGHTDTEAITGDTVAQALSEKFGIEITAEEVLGNLMDNDKSDAMDKAGFNKTLSTYVQEYLREQLPSDLDI